MKTTTGVALEACFSIRRLPNIAWTRPTNHLVDINTIRYKSLTWTQKLTV